MHSSSIPCVDWHAHNAPLVGAGAGGAPFCLSEVVVTVFAVLFRFKWWWMLRTRPGLVSGGQDTFPRCVVSPGSSPGLVTAPHRWQPVGGVVGGFMEWTCPRCGVVAVGVPA